MNGKTSPTMKFEDQLVRTAIPTAAGRGPCENSSVIINHGIEPTIRKVHTVFAYIYMYRYKHILFIEYISEWLTD